MIGLIVRGRRRLCCREFGGPPWRQSLARGRLRRRDSSGFRSRSAWRRRVRGQFGDRAGQRLLAIGQPDVVNWMLDRVQTGARCKHPAGEDALDLALQCHFVDFDKGIGVGGLGGWPRVARTRGDLQRAELHRLADRRVELDGAAGDFVETGKNRAAVFDLFGRCFYDGRIVFLARRSDGLRRIGLLRRSRASRRRRRRGTLRRRGRSCFPPIWRRRGNRCARRRWQWLRLDAVRPARTWGRGLSLYRVLLCSRVLLLRWILLLRGILLLRWVLPGILNGWRLDRKRPVWNVSRRTRRRVA